MSHGVIDLIHHKSRQENTITGLSILNHWREEIPDGPVHSNDLSNPAEDDETLDDDLSYHHKDGRGSLSSPHRLNSESVTPIEASLSVLDLIDNLPIEGVEHDQDPDAVEPDDETINTELEGTHTDKSDLFVPEEAPANPVITPCLSQAMMLKPKSGKVRQTDCRAEI